MSTPFLCGPPRVTKGLGRIAKSKQGRQWVNAGVYAVCSMKQTAFVQPQPLLWRIGLCVQSPRCG